MIDFKNIKTIFFDYDGTLHDSMKIYAPAFREAYAYLVENGHAEAKDWEDNEISYWLGFNSTDMWKAFMPHLPVEITSNASGIIGAEMRKLVEEGTAVLYEGAIETLEYLKKKGYHLVFISNCRIYYRDAHKNMFQLDQYFEELVCSEEYAYIPKHEIMHIIMKKYPQEMVIIGDRIQDIEAGYLNDIYSIGCLYGFAGENELQKADVTISNITDLKELF